jgi:hypothetical protein
MGKGSGMKHIKTTSASIFDFDDFVMMRFKILQESACEAVIVIEIIEISEHVVDTLVLFDRTCTFLKGELIQYVLNGSRPWRRRKHGWM